MTAHELNNVFEQNNWDGWDTFENDEKYSPSHKIRYALVASLQDESLAEPNNFRIPSWIRVQVEHKAKADQRTIHQFDPAPRNKTTAQLLKEFDTKGMRIKARKALKERVPYVSFEEQQKILRTFFENASVDRLFALRYLDTHWDDYYTPFVEKAWHEHHEMESARVICHHFPQSFVLDNRQDLAKDYNYLQVRLRLPSSFEIDREQLSDSAYLYLCARQSIPVRDEEAEELFYKNVLNAIGYYYIRNPWRVNPRWSKQPHITDNSLCDIPIISSMVWSLGMLGKTDILLRFVEFNKEIYPLVNQGKWQEIRDEFERRGFDFDYTMSDMEFYTIGLNG
ncbi:MAG: hypothetical protein IKX20_07170 [Paludibacteraceae bacterium]|nr:hypothetical protein [Paludibacteraceae bacterium]